MTFTNFMPSLSSKGRSLRGIDMIIAFHDVRRPIGRNREAWLISRKRLDQMIDDGLPAAILDRLDRLMLIVDSVDDMPLCTIKGDLSRMAQHTPRRFRRRRCHHRRLH